MQIDLPPIIEAAAEFEGRENGYRPVIHWNRENVWEADFTIPFHEGDYGNSQEALAVHEAEKHMVERLRRLFE